MPFSELILVVSTAIAAWAGPEARQAALPPSQHPTRLAAGILETTANPLDLPARLRVVRVPLLLALVELQERSGVSLVYSPSRLPRLEVTCDCESLRVAEALRRLLAGAGGLRFSAVGRHVLIETDEPFPARPAAWGTPVMPTASDTRSSPLLVTSTTFTPILPPREPDFAPAAQARGVAGVVLNGRSLEPVPGAQVTVVGGTANQGATSDAQGRFRIEGLGGNEVTLRAVAIGFRPLTQTARPGAADLRLLLTEAAVNLEEIIVTGQAGAVEKRSVANAVSTVSAAELVEVAPVTDVSQLIRGRAAGSLVRVANGTVGGGSRITLRGSASIGLNDQPIIYVDGVRVDRAVGVGLANEGAGTPNGALSRINDFNPDDIESVEIIKGPAAATLYGTEAANGVIQIITKKGRRGEKVKWGASVR